MQYKYTYTLHGTVYHILEHGRVIATTLLEAVADDIVSSLNNTTNDDFTFLPQ